MSSKTSVLPLVIDSDLYEIVVNGKSVTLIYYPRSVDTRGEEVDFDSLLPHVQQRIYDHLKTFLAKEKRRKQTEEQEENETSFL